MSEAINNNFLHPKVCNFLTLPFATVGQNGPSGPIVRTLAAPA